MGAGILTWSTCSLVKMTHSLYIFYPCREFPLSSPLSSSFIVFIMILSPNLEFIPRLFPFLIHSPSLFHVTSFSELPGALYGHFHISLCKCSFSQAQTQGYFSYPSSPQCFRPKPHISPHHMAPGLASIICSLGNDHLSTRINRLTPLLMLILPDNRLAKLIIAIGRGQRLNLLNSVGLRLYISNVFPA